ncbi:hypothetical protein FHT77_003851 [Rhizobium sp. BK181]|nr:hypothetical protein [Rhizobium sp. BK181]
MPGAIMSRTLRWISSVMFIAYWIGAISAGDLIMRRALSMPPPSTSLAAPIWPAKAW